MKRIIFFGLLLVFSAHSVTAQELKPSTANDSPLPTFKKNPEDFFYAQQTSMWVFYKVPKEIILRQIGDTLSSLGLELASFEDENVGYLIVKPMVFMAEFGFQNATARGTSASTEVEFTALTYPKGREPANAGSFDAFLRGEGKASSVGQLRLDVLCDEEVAVAAGRKNFGEHKFLGSFEYNYPTPNQNIGESKPFTMDMTAYTWNGAGDATRKMFRIQASAKNLKPKPSRFSPEFLFSSFPPEFDKGTDTKTVGEYRYYDNRNFHAFLPEDVEVKVDLSFGDAMGAHPLSPVPPFGDNKPIPNSEHWPKDMVAKMKNTLSSGIVAGLLLYQTPPAEYETKPFEIKK